MTLRVKLLHGAVVHFFLLLSSPLSGHSAIHLSSCLLVGIWVVSGLGLFQIVFMYFLYKSLIGHVLSFFIWSGMGGSYVKHGFAFLSNCRTVYKVMMSHYIPASHVWVFQWLHILPTLAVASFFFTFIPSSRFPRGWWIMMSSFSHPSIFFSEIFVQIYPFWIVHLLLWDSLYVLDSNPLSVVYVAKCFYLSMIFLFLFS